MKRSCLFLGVSEREGIIECFTLRKLTADAEHKPDICSSFASCVYHSAKGVEKSSFTHAKQFKKAKKDDIVKAWQKR